MISLQHPLPLFPLGAKTIFWRDKFHCKKDTKGDSVNTCHGETVQENSDGCMNRDETLDVPNSYKTTVSFVPQVSRKVKVMLHKEPQLFDIVKPVNITMKMHAKYL